MTEHEAIAAKSTILLAKNLRLRPADARGHADHGWLRSAHSFSFANYFDPEHIQFHNLRVINDDWVAGGRGFPAHPHTDAEIFSYVLHGALAHKDSMGNGSTVKAGGVQYMSAGAGVTHSEFNPSETVPMRFLQVWLLPSESGGSPRYETLDIAAEEKDGTLKLFLSADGRKGSMRIKSDADIYAATLNGNQDIDFVLREGRKGWVQVAAGSLRVNGINLRCGDGLAVENAGRLKFENGEAADVLLFDLQESTA